MKLKNKKTGEIKECVVIPIDDNGYPNEYQVFDKGESLAELNEEWCDYEEPKEHWFIDYDGGIIPFNRNKETATDNLMKQIGNYFETEEDAEEAVEKLKAMAKLKEFGFRFIDWELDMKTVADGKIWFDVGVNTEWDAERLLELKPEVKKSLDILFSQEGD